MERFAGRVVEIREDPDGEGLRVSLTIVKVQPPGDLPLTYELVIDAQAGSMTPEGELGECFEVYHEHEDGSGLNPKLRRMWKTARVADEIVSRLLGSRALATVASDE